MEFLVVILLVIIAYQLYKLNNKNETKSYRDFPERENLSIKSPAFSKQEWDEAVNAWFEKQLREDRESGQFGTPNYHVWEPPNYDEVKYDRHKLENLRTMAGLKDEWNGS